MSEIFEVGLYSFEFNEIQSKNDKSAKNQIF